MDPRSQTATFGAVKLSVDNWRWQGVPFYLRSLKASSCRTTQIVIQFRQPPHMMFESDARPFDANRLVLQIQPAEGIQIHFMTKVPDSGMKLRMTDLDFSFRDQYAGGMPEAYQRLLLDVLNGDASLFARSDEVELAWGIIDPIQRVWESSSAPPWRFTLKGTGGRRFRASGWPARAARGSTCAPFCIKSLHLRPCSCSALVRSSWRGPPCWPR